MGVFRDEIYKYQFTLSKTYCSPQHGGPFQLVQGLNRLADKQEEFLPRLAFDWNCNSFLSIPNVVLLSDFGLANLTQSYEPMA